MDRQGKMYQFPHFYGISPLSGVHRTLISGRNKEADDRAQLN